MTTNNNTVNINQQSLNITATDPLEENLSWLQEFHNINIKSLIKNKKKHDSIMLFSSSQYLPDTTIRISNVCNPGWSLEFIDSNKKVSNWLPLDIDQTMNISGKTETKSLRIGFRGQCYNSFGSALYLNLSIEFFKLYNTAISPCLENLMLMRNKLQAKNPLLTWLEEFYFSCCDGDWEHLYGFDISSTQSGWTFKYDIESGTVHDKPFEDNTIEDGYGVTKCYRQDDQFIIDTHPKGLIAALNIFKSWIES